MVKAVIFDMDGLMFDTEPIWASCWPIVIAEFGLPYKEGLADAMRGTNGHEAVAIVASWYGEAADAAKIVSRYYEIAHEKLTYGGEKKPGLDNLIDYLFEQGIPMAVASSSSPEMIKSNLERAGIAERYSAVVSGLEVEHAKPFPDVFLRAASLLGVNPKDSLVLEDSYNGVRAAAAGNFITIMIPDLSQPTDEMRELASKILPDLNEVKVLLERGAL